MKVSKAVIEKNTEDSITLLVGDEEKEVVIPKYQITQNTNYHEGDWVDVEIDGDTVKIIRVDEEETANVKKRVQSKLDLLRSRMANYTNRGKISE